MRRTEIVTALVSLCLVSALWGCKKDEPAPPPPPPPKAPVVKQQQLSAAPADSFTQVVDFSSRRDPFKPFVEDIKPGDKPVGPKGMLPIQNYELVQFRVTGIIVGLKENFAQVVDPTGKAYTLKKGMSIGNRSGRVTAITPTYIEVVERTADDTGRVRNRTERLVIPKKS